MRAIGASESMKRIDVLISENAVRSTSAVADESIDGATTGGGVGFSSIVDLRSGCAFSLSASWSVLTNRHGTADSPA